jgi:phage portal protein BeeE
MLRISPHIIYQLDSQKLANVQQMGAEVVKYSLTPWATKIEDEINRKLFSTADQDAGYFFKLNMDSLLRGDRRSDPARIEGVSHGGIRTGIRQ